jgi:hypothetical protein
VKILLVSWVAVCIHSIGFGQGVVDSTRFVSKPDTSAGAKDAGWLSVLSDPEGAEVYDGSKLLGVTPIDSVSIRDGNHVLRLFYPSVRFWNPVSAIDTIIVIPRQRVTSAVHFGVEAGHGIFRGRTETSEWDPNAIFASQNSKSIRECIGYAAGATMIVSGALSAYLKTNSDNDFNVYIVHRDPNLLSRVRRLDRWAGVSLFISEISFGVLTYLFLSE